MTPGNATSSKNQFAILPMWVIDRIKEEMRLGPAAWQAITDAVEQAETPQALPCEVKLPPGTVIGQGSPLSTLLMAIAQRARQPAHAQVFSKEPPAPQSDPEPLAWMVGTAIWWTKEEAERDATAMDLPVVGLGPMTGSASAEQHQGEPVGEVVAFGKGLHEIAWAAGRMPKLGAKLYTHADPAEVERIKAELAESDHAFVRMASEAEKLHAQLAERDALLKQAQWYLSNALPFYHGAASGEVISDANRVCHEIRTLLSASAEPSAPTWSCQACQVEQPNDRACDACGGQTALIAAKS